jgi:hypothetical protein
MATATSGGCSGSLRRALNAGEPGAGLVKARVP